MRRSDDTFLVVAGTIVGILAAGLFLAGVAVLLVGTFGTQDGYFRGETVSLTSDGHAVRTEQLALGADPGAWFPDGGAVRTRIVVTPDEPEVSLFTGIAHSDDLDGWLDDVAHTVVEVVESGDVEVDVVSGSASPTRPVDEDFWAVSSSGQGTRTIVWDHRYGDWELVVANVDGSAGLATTGEGSVRLRLATQVGLSMVAAGLVIALFALVVLWTAFRHRRRPDRAAPSEERPDRLPVGSGGDPTSGDA